MNQPRRHLLLPVLLSYALIGASSLDVCRSLSSDSGTKAAEQQSAVRFDFHTVRGRESKVTATGIFEGEQHLTLEGSSRVQGMSHYGEQWSGNAHLLWDGVVGDSFETTFRLDKGGRYRLLLQLTKAPDYGRFSVTLSGASLHSDVDLYAPRVELAKRLDLGEVMLKTGEQKLVCKLIGANDRARKFRGRGYLLGLDYLKLERLDPEPAAKAAPESKPTAATESETGASRIAADFATIQPLLQQHCLECHSGDDAEGDVRFESLTSRQGFLEQIDQSRRAVRAITRGEMPPEDSTPLSPADRRKLTTFFDSVIDEYLDSAGSVAPVVMRRMNRYEYSNAVRDLLQLKGDVFPLPEKAIRPAADYFDPASGHFPSTVVVGNRTLGKNQVEKHILTGVSPFAIDLQSEHGFNNRGEELSFSPILLESLLRLGQSIVHSPEFDDYCQATPNLFSPSDGTSNDEQTKVARQHLAALLERAFRSPVDGETIDRYVRYFSSVLKVSGSFSDAMKSTVAALLASPRFIYIAEQGQEEESDSDREAKSLTAWELASRLSFFLWSSIPDAELLDAARSGELLKPTVLEQQVRRMLEDRRSQALAENFARQWLRLDQLITAVPDFDRFPAYYSRIGCEQWKFGLQTMLEPILLFESVMVEDRSIMLLVDSNYSFRSDELQSWYSADSPFKGKDNRNRFNTFQQAFHRRHLKSRREGGVITTSAVLTMTSSPLRTSPITRGAWVAGVIFNQPPPPPPDVVPEIEADDKAIEEKGLTLRQRLEQHRVNQACASCHSKIDSLGFALENFDAVGRWRDAYRSGLPIDASGTLFGESQFDDVIGLKDALLDHPEWFMRAFSEHLLAYALGRELTLTDRPHVDQILNRVVADHGQFSTVVTQIVLSKPFRHKVDRIEDSQP